MDSTAGSRSSFTFAVFYERLFRGDVSFRAYKYTALNQELTAWSGPTPIGIGLGKGRNTQKWCTDRSAFVFAGRRATPEDVILEFTWRRRGVGIIAPWFLAIWFRRLRQDVPWRRTACTSPFI